MICLWQRKVSRALLVSHKFVLSLPAASRTARPTSSSYRNKGDIHANNEEKDGNSKEENLSRKKVHLTPGSRLVSLLPQKYWEEEALEVKEVIEKVAGSLLIEDTQTAAHHYESENGNSNRNFVTPGNTINTNYCREQQKRESENSSHSQVECGTNGLDKPEFYTVKSAVKPDMVKFHPKTKELGLEPSNFKSHKPKSAEQYVKFQRRRGSLNVASRLSKLMKANVPDSDGGQRKD